MYIDHMPEEGERLEAQGITLVDGSKPKNGDPVICGSCGTHMDDLDFCPKVVIEQ